MNNKRGSVRFLNVTRHTTLKGWQFSKRVSGPRARASVTKFFSDKTYGSSANALVCAINYRNNFSGIQ